MDIDQWIVDIKEVTDEVVDTTSSLEQEILNWKPSAGSWSIAQVLEHLITINESYLNIPDEIRADKHSVPFLGRIPFIVNLFGKLLLKSVQPEEKRKAKTFPIWEPSKSDINADIVERFRESQDILKKWIVDNQDLIESNPVVSSPANVNVVYRFRTLIEIIVTHEKRHLMQIHSIIKQQASTGL